MLAMLAAMLAKLASRQQRPGSPTGPRCGISRAPTLGNRLADQVEKCFADNYLVTGLQLDRIARHQARLAINIGAVETTDILDRDLAAFEADQRVLARDLGLGIVLVEVDFGKRAGLGIPSADEV